MSLYQTDWRTLVTAEGNPTVNNDDERDYAEEAANRAHMLDERVTTLAEMLVNGARDGGLMNVQAAAHLLTFPELLEHLVDHPPFRENLSMSTVTRRGADSVTDLPVARLKSWLRVSHFADELHLGSAAYTMLSLAGSLASGAKVCLRDEFGSLDTAHATRIVEAMAIASGLTQRHDVTVTRRQLHTTGRMGNSVVREVEHGVGRIWTS